MKDLGNHVENPERAADALSSMSAPEWLVEQLTTARHNATESGMFGTNSYGGGYDQGYSDALEWVYEQIMGAP